MLPSGESTTKTYELGQTTQESLYQASLNIQQSTMSESKLAINFVKNIINNFKDAVTDFASSTISFFSNFENNFNLRSIGNYLDENLHNITTIVSTIALGALLVASVATGGSALVIAGTIVKIGGIIAATTGGLQFITGINGYTIGGDQISAVDRSTRIIEVTLNVIAGAGLYKAGLKYIASGNIIKEVAKKTIVDGSETSNLYRVMSEGEYNSLNNAGKFTSYEKAMKTKWFATNKTDATE